MREVLEPPAQLLPKREHQLTKSTPKQKVAVPDVLHRLLSAGVKVWSEEADKKVHKPVQQGTVRERSRLLVEYGPFADKHPVADAVAEQPIPAMHCELSHVPLQLFRLEEAALMEPLKPQP